MEPPSDLELALGASLAALPPRELGRGARDRRKPRLVVSHHHESPTWRALPDVVPPEAIPFPGGMRIEVAGEHYYQPGLSALCGGDADVHFTCRAVLRPEPTNPYSPAAVSVEILGTQVGYLPTLTALAFRPVTEMLIATGATGLCAAIICADWDKWSGGDLQVELDLAGPPELVALLEARASHP